MELMSQPTEIWESWKWDFTIYGGVYRRRTRFYNFSSAIQINGQKIAACHWIKTALLFSAGQYL
jgi:hypothetical protein